MASAATNPADIVLGLTADRAVVGADGGPVQLTVSVRNAGGAEATDTTVKFSVPAGATLSFGDGPFGWSCDAALAKCRGGDLAAGADTSFNARVTLPAGADGQAVTVTATGATQSHESPTTNNASSATVAYSTKPDLAFSFMYGSGTISYLGGNGALGFVQARATNVGMTTAPDVRFTVQVPPGTTTRPGLYDEAWRCDFTTLTWVCDSDQDIPPGEIAYLNLYPYFPAGTAGDTRTLTGSVSTSTPERSAADNTGTTTFTYVVPTPGDVELYGLNVVGRTELRANEDFELSVAVGVRGGSPSESVTVRVPLPTTIEPTSLDPGDPNWTCRLNDAVDDRFLECVRASWWDIATEDAHLSLKLTAKPGTPAGPLTFTATASADSVESSPDNNTASDTVTYIAEGRIAGTVWIDLDRDGQRDADEPTTLGGMARFELVPESGDLPWYERHADTNSTLGTYYKRLKPGRYTVVAHVSSGSTTQFTTPDVGDDATDSDIVTTVSDYWDPRGLSAIVEVTDGGLTVVDIGLLPQP